MNWEQTAPTEAMRIAEFCFGRVLRRRSAEGSTACETFLLSTAVRVKVYDRGIARGARAIDGDLGSCLLIECGRLVKRIPVGPGKRAQDPFLTQRMGTSGIAIV
jgi:hypothetical protein